MREYRRELPVTDELARTNLALPMGPDLTDAQAEETVAALRAAAERLATR
jgi:dTDP-4-amino-4,6-dideoxygalactose transaminase